MMKPRTRFFIRTTDKKKGKAPLHINVIDRMRGIDLKLNTDIVVEVNEWLDAQATDQSFFAYQYGHQDIFQKLMRIEDIVKNALRDLNFDKDKLYLDVWKVSESLKYNRLLQKKAMEDEAMSDLARVQSDYQLQEKAKEEAIKTNIWNFIVRFCSEIESGLRRNGSERYTAGSVKSWKSFKSLYDRFDQKHKHTWSQIDRTFANRFVTFLEDNYNVTSQNKHIGNMKAIINYSFVDGLHDNERAIRFFQKKREKEGSKATDVWLTENELDALFAMKIEDKRDAEVRDVFLVGCYTCQRVSDYKAIPHDAFQHTDKHTLVINLIQQKTGARVCIPVIGTNLKSILERYNYNLPKVNDQFLNKRIKLILKDLSENVPSLKKKVPVLLKRGKGGTLPDDSTVSKDASGNPVKPRYACVTSHTARRTGITRLYNRGILDELELMKISGHRDLKVFRDYIKLSAEEIADRISEKASQDSLL